MSDTNPLEKKQPTRSDTDSARLVLGAGSDDYLDLRSSQEADPGAISLSRSAAEQYRNTFMRSDTQLLDDQAELQKKRDELQAIRNKLDGLDAQMARLEQSNQDKQKYFLYGLAGLLALGCLGWLFARRNTVAQQSGESSGVFDSSENHVASAEQVAVVEQHEQALFKTSEESADEVADTPEAFEPSNFDAIDSAIDNASVESDFSEADFSESEFTPESQNQNANAELPSFGKSVESKTPSVHLDVDAAQDLGVEEAAEDIFLPDDVQSVGKGVEDAVSEKVDISMTSLAQLPENDAPPAGIKTLETAEELPPVEPQPVEAPATQATIATNTSPSVDISFSALGALPVAKNTPSTSSVQKANEKQESGKQEKDANGVTAGLADLPKQTAMAPKVEAASAHAPRAIEPSDLEITDAVGTSAAGDVVISDGMTPEEVDIRLSRLGSLPTSADSATPTEASTSTPVVLAGAADLPSDVQQQIRVEQLLRTLSGEADNSTEPSASAVAPSVSAAPSAARPEADAVKDGNLYEPFNPVDMKPTSLNMKESEADRMLAEEEAVFRTQDSSVLMQLDMPEAGSKKEQSLDLVFESEASDNDVSGGVESDVRVGDSVFATVDGAKHTMTATSDDAPQEARSANMPLTMYEEMVELKQSNTTFRYDDFGFEADESEQSEPKPEETATSAATEVAVAAVNTQAEEPVAFEKTTPWYKKLFGRKKQKGAQNPSQSQKTDVGESGLPSFLNADDAAADVKEVNTEERLAKVWQDSNDWMPESEPAVPDNAVYDEIDLVPDAQVLGDLRARPNTGESLLGFLRHLYKQVTALKQAGEVVRARSLLLEHVMIMPTTSAWAYLEYLSLSDSNSDDALVVSSKFKEQFNRFPPVDRAKITGMNVRPKLFLEYEQALHSLCNVWPEERACDLLDKWLTGYASNMRLFSLHAYRELFLLYDILDVALQTPSKTQSGDEKSALESVDIDLF